VTRLANSTGRTGLWVLWKTWTRAWRGNRCAGRGASAGVAWKVLSTSRFGGTASESVSVMPKLHFHCTDGRDLVLDREGVEVVAETNLLWLASRAAARLMSELPEYDGWSEWVVAVHDERGCLLETVPFVHGAEWGDAEVTQDAWPDSNSPPRWQTGRTPSH
jgi:hypothetical protein